MSRFKQGIRGLVYITRTAADHVKAVGQDWVKLPLLDPRALTPQNPQLLTPQNPHRQRYPGTKQEPCRSLPGQRVGLPPTPSSGETVTSPPTVVSSYRAGRQASVSGDLSVHPPVSPLQPRAPPRACTGQSWPPLPFTSGEQLNDKMLNDKKRAL